MIFNLLFLLVPVAIINGALHEIDQSPENPEDVIVETKYGKINGFTYEMDNGKKANIFLGVPYASAPIGDLKLEKPVPPKPWDGTKITRKWPLPCSPHDGLITKWTGPHSEDCLYLNIFTPTEPSTDPNGFPIAIWIHGGGFSFGGTYKYGFKAMSNNFVSQGIIIVSIQYRLGPFGFFSLGDDVAPGNLGLWDQRQALLFLHDVLPSMGGNTKQITVWGHSAGGTSTSLLSASPHSRDLFQQGFQMSGSSFVEWGNSKRVINVSRQIAGDLGCLDTDDSRKIKECVKSKTTEEIHTASDKLGLSRNDLNFDWYHPVAETDWFGKDYENELKDAPKKPVLIGVTSAESYLATATFHDIADRMFTIHMGYEKEEQALYTKQMLEDFIRNKIATKETFGDDTESAIQDLFDYYIERGTVVEKKNPRFYFTRYTAILSDIQFNIPTIWDGIVKTALNWPTYIYLFDWVNPQLAQDTGYYDGAQHGLELAYLHGFQTFTDFDFIDVDHQVKDLYVNGVANFFKYGNPSGNGREWPRMSGRNDFKYMLISENSTVDDSFFKHRLDFWDKFNKKYNFNLIRGEFKHTRNLKDEL